MKRQRSLPNGNTKNKLLSSTFRRRHRTCMVISRRWFEENGKVMPIVYNARAPLLFSSLNLCLVTFSLPSSPWFAYAPYNIDDDVRIEVWLRNKSQIWTINYLDFFKGRLLGVIHLNTQSLELFFQLILCWQQTCNPFTTKKATYANFNSS